MINYQLKGESSGKAPSAVVLQDNEIYQLKRSNCTNVGRRIIGMDPDPSDLLGEFIASRLLKKMLPDQNNGLELAPKVDLVTSGSKLGHKEIEDFRITSRYFKNEKYEQIDLAAFIKQKTPTGKRQKKNATVVLADGDNNQINLNNTYKYEIPEDNSTRTIKLDKASFYDALAASMILGEHDINPGNFFIMIPTNGKDVTAKFGRIDMGHAFNDLIKDWRGDHSPKLYHTQGRGVVRNMINGDTLNAMGNNKTKFLRDFGDGITLDPEFANALERMAEKQDMKEVVNQAIKELKTRFKNDDKNKDDIIKAGKTLLYRMGIKDSGITVLDSLDQVCTRLKTECDNFVQKNCEEAKSVAAVLHVQIAVDNAIKASKINTEELIALLNKDPYLQKSLDKPVEWMRTKQSEQPFVGKFEDYVQHRQQQLSKEQQQDNKKDKKASRVPRDYSSMSKLQVGMSVLAALAAVTAAVLLGPIAVTAAILATSGVVFGSKAYNMSKKAEYTKKAEKLFKKCGNIKDITVNIVQEKLEGTWLQVEFNTASKLDKNKNKSSSQSFAKKVGKNDDNLKTILKNGSQYGNQNFSEKVVQSSSQGQQQGQQKG